MRRTRNQTGGTHQDKPLVVQVVRQYAPARGGLEDVVANLCKALPPHGYRVKVVTCDRLFTAPDVKLPAHEIIDGVEICRIPWAGTKRYPLAPAVFAHLADADLIHVHAVDFFFDALALGRIFHRKPMIATTHGGFFHTPRHAAIKKLWFNAVTRMSASQYRALACCSQSDLALFREVAGDRPVLVENGVDALKFSPPHRAAPSKRLATIGRFSVNKRLDRLLDTMAVLVADDAEWQLDIIGIGSDLSAADLKAMIGSRGLDGHVCVHLGPEDAVIRERLGQASLFVSASDYEGFGLVAVEAMGAGLVPVLHINDAYRSLAGSHTGIALADFADPKSSAAVIVNTYRALVENPDRMVEAMQMAASGYSWDKVSARYAALYAQALASG